MKELYCENSGVFLIFGNMCVQKVYGSGTTQTLETLYAGREEHRIVYSGVLYSAFGRRSGKLEISMAERLPARALRGPRYRKASSRMLDDGIPDVELLVKEAETAGCHLFLHYVGDEEEYAVLAKEVNIYS